MKLCSFAARCAKEILRDPLNILFGLGFPIVLLLLLSAIQANIPVHLFEIEQLGPGITIFGLSFLTLFSSTLIAKDRESALLQRLYTTPMKAADFILGYLLPILPIALAQCAVCYVAAILLGLPVTINIVYAILLVIPVAIFQIALGLLCGSIFSSKQVGGICGAFLTNLSAWLSGIWFDPELVGDLFHNIAHCLPFLHAAKMEQAVIAGDFNAIPSHLGWIVGYALVASLGAVLLFLHQMKRQ